MAKSLRISAAVTTAVLVMLFSWAIQPVQALGPTVLMFYGGTLEKPILVTGADVDAFGDLTRRSTVGLADVAGRDYLNVALFWGPANNPALNGRSLAELTPNMAWQHGRFYPPAGSRPALLLTTGLTKSNQAVPVPSNGAAFTTGGALSDSALPVLRKIGLVPGAGRSTSR